MALGEILKNAREQKGLTPSAVAESTHMKVQVVEDLEREDFRRIAAPIYGRGFVKLYAEFLQLDPEPLIRDFMELYGGARAPAVRTKRVDASSAEPQPESVPVTRTVTGASAALPPQKQPVQPKPAVRPLSVPAVPLEAARAVGAEATKLSVAEERKGLDAGSPAPAPIETVSSGAEEEGAGEAFNESDEPDLFKPQTPRRRPAVAEEPQAESGRRSPASGEDRVSSKPRLPVFKVGGRLEERREPAVQDDAAHARRRARIDTFIEGVKNLRDGVERKLPAALPRKQMVALIGAAAALLVLMAVGIGVLFKMTGSNVKEAPGATVGMVAPLPDLYVD